MPLPKKTFILTANAYYTDGETDREIDDKFQKYGTKVERVEFIQFIIFTPSRFVKKFILFVYRIFDKESLQSYAIKIADVLVDEKYRNRGIGKQLMQTLDEIARENDIKLIVGELQADGKDGSLEQRKRFFKENGFEVRKKDRSPLSGWIIRKAII